MPFNSLTHAFFLFLCFHCSYASPPENPIKCTSSNINCTITNSYGAFPDRDTCRAYEVAYPYTEDELIEAVAKATRENRKMKVASKYCHSMTKLMCPGGDDGLIISTRFLDHVVSIDNRSMTVTVESGMVLKDLISAAAKAGMALPYAPYWWGVTVGGMLGTGAHGSSTWGLGSAVHEYVVGLRIITPASLNENYAKVVLMDENHPDMDAFKVSLGVLGVISQVTLKLQPLFKRSITYLEQNDTDIEEIVQYFHEQHEFGDIRWYPSQRKVMYRVDDRVSINTAGNGLYNFIGFRPIPSLAIAIARASGNLSGSYNLTILTLKLALYRKNTTLHFLEEALEATSNADGKCFNAQAGNSVLSITKYGLTNNGYIFTGYPVIGLQNRMQASGDCLTSSEDALITACPWDPRLKDHSFFHQTAFTIAISKAKNFILDVKKLRDTTPKALCVVELYDGILMRYVKGSSTYMGKEEDSIDFDFTYYRSHDPMSPRLHEDVLEEIEQMALFKYGGLPHWGKNRNIAFDGVIHKYRNGKEFLKVMDEYDPNGLFSNEWTNQILGIEGRTVIYGKGCALEGMCICSEDAHCAPEKGYFCHGGRVYEEARVCSRVIRK